MQRIFYLYIDVNKTIKYRCVQTGLYFRNSMCTEVDINVDKRISNERILSKNV